MLAEAGGPRRIQPGLLLRDPAAPSSVSLLPPEVLIRLGKSAEQECLPAWRAEVPAGRTHLAVTVELVCGGQGGNLWPRQGRVLIASRSAAFEQLAETVDGTFARWDRSHLHEFTLADGTPISPLRR